MSVETVTNLFANAVLTAAVSGFGILLFRSDSVVKKWPAVGHFALKASLVAVSAGSLGNCLTLSTPPFTEILLNVGLAGLFSWAVWFHIRLLNLKNGPTSKHRKGGNGRNAGQVAANR